MNIFKVFGSDINYKNSIQLDGAFSVSHTNYNKFPIFNGTGGENIIKTSIKSSLSSKGKIENVIDCIDLFNGTEKNFKVSDRILLWKSYWKEYINSFSKLVDILPNSIVTIYVGRQAIELGLKYLLLKKTKSVEKTHDLDKLSNLLFIEYGISDEYMKNVNLFCKYFCKYVEGGNNEYFRFPEYRGNTYFAGNELDIEWLSYNFALIILKLIHFANIDDEV